MKTGMSQKSVVLAAAAFLIVQGFAFAEGLSEEKSYREKKEQREETMKKVMDEIGLTEPQREQIKEYRSQHKEVSGQLRMELKEKKKQLREELTKTDSNEAALRGLADEIKRIQGQIIDHKIESILEMKKIMTPEQYQKFKEKTKDFHGKAKNRKKDYHKCSQAEGKS
ncbi:MAG: periplasmic heavy metal sensor [Candidatus Omnitrophota bacterium]